MVSGAMDLFAVDFGKLISTTVRGQIFGSKEVVYQAYVCAFFTAAAEATKVNPGWEIEVERYSGIGRLDLIIQRMRGSNATIEEHKRIDFSGGGIKRRVIVNHDADHLPILPKKP